MTGLVIRAKWEREKNYLTKQETAEETKEKFVKLPLVRKKVNWLQWKSKWRPFKCNEKRGQNGVGSNTNDNHNSNDDSNRVNSGHLTRSHQFFVSHSGQSYQSQIDFRKLLFQLDFAQSGKTGKMAKARGNPQGWGYARRPEGWKETAACFKRNWISQAQEVKIGMWRLWST